MKPVRLLWLVVILALGWSAWWGLGAWNAKRDLQTWLEERRAAGWQAEWDSIKVRGYPTRIDRTITGLTLANTEGGWVWTAPFFQILGLNYEKGHVILVWPNEMTLQTPWQMISISGEELRGSVTYRPEAEQEIVTATLVFKELALVSDAGWSSTIAELRLAGRPTAGKEGWHDIGLSLSGVKPRSELVATLAQAGLVPAEIDHLTADLAVAFDHPWNRRALEQDRPQIREIEIRNIGAVWGALELRIAGDLSLDETGRVSGDVLVKSTNWRDMLELARRSGLVPEALFGPIESGLTLLSGLAGRRETLDIPLSFRDGRTMLGPIPIGPAPVLRIP